MGGQKGAAAIAAAAAQEEEDMLMVVYYPMVYGAIFRNMDLEVLMRLVGTEPCSLPVKPGLKSSVISAAGQKFLIGANSRQQCIQRYVVL